MTNDSTSGKENQRKKQAGEYIVAAELCRRGFFATTFTGNMPDFDILAIDDSGNLMKIQVKKKRQITGILMQKNSYKSQKQKMRIL